MSQRSWPTPPPGVSTTDGQGNHKPIEVDPTAGKTSNRRTARRMPGEDVLLNVGSMESVQDSTGMTPTGVKSLSRDVRIGAIPKTRRSRKHTKTFRSVDGKEYSFRSHDTKGKELPDNRLFMLVVALREVSLGGSPQPVFDAWGLKVTDVDGKQFYPAPREVLEMMQADSEVMEMLDVEEEDEAAEQFSLGKAE